MDIALPAKKCLVIQLYFDLTATTRKDERKAWNNWKEFLAKLQTRQDKAKAPRSRHISEVWTKPATLKVSRYQGCGVTAGVGLP